MAGNTEVIPTLAPEAFCTGNGSSQKERRTDEEYKQARPQFMRPTLGTSASNFGSLQLGATLGAGFASEKEWLAP